MAATDHYSQLAFTLHLRSLSSPASYAGGPSSGSSVALSAALSCALCLIHRLKSAPSRTRPALSSRPRILCLMGSPDVPMQYIPIMNAIFSAQVSDLVSPLFKSPALWGSPR